MEIISNGKFLIIKVDPELYSKKVVLNSLYWLTSKYQVDVELTENNYVITITGQDPSVTELHSEITRKVKQNLIDFNLRETIEKESKLIKELIIAKAFSSLDIYDTPPSGEIKDPVEIKKSTPHDGDRISDKEV